MSLKPSKEQQTIIDNIKINNNIICDAVAGAGKTTTVISIAKQLPNKNILQITYNSQLKTETRERVKSEKITNLKIHTYHSLVKNYYDNDVYTDDKMVNVINIDKDLINSYDLDILIIDEAQDMTQLYYTLLKKYLNDIYKSDIQVVILGDKNQGIYKFKNADIRYLTLGDKLWKGKFINCPLHTSYRLTDNISWFINRIVLGKKRIKTIKI